MHLLDSNVLIDANRDYYPLSRVPEFWDWLVDLDTKGLVKIPLEMFEEIKDGDDDLGEWIRRDEVKDALLLDEDLMSRWFPGSPTKGTHPISPTTR